MEDLSQKIQGADSFLNHIENPDELTKGKKKNIIVIINNYENYKESLKYVLRILRVYSYTRNKK